MVSDTPHLNTFPSNLDLISPELPRSNLENAFLKREIALHCRIILDIKLKNEDILLVVMGSKNILNCI